MPDHRPCQSCGKYACEWRTIDRVRWAVTAPDGASIKPGQRWTCTICLRRTQEPESTHTEHGQQNTLSL